MSIALEVWGDYALFSRPEFKAERVSYDVMTPSAARGILESIYWHPGMRYQIDRIHVCSPIQFGNIRRNEVGAVVLYTTMEKTMKKGGKAPYIATSKNRQQRASLLLRDVHYVIEAHFDMTDKATSADNPGKFQDILTRRIRKGQFYSQPYFGCREFPVHFKMCEELPTCPEELKGTRDLGWMLYDMNYDTPGEITPMFFRGQLNDGVLEVPPRNSEEVRG